MSIYCKFGGTSGDYLSKSMIGGGKPSAYAVNGTGRDTYISIDNGGLYKGYEPYPAADVGTFN